MSRIAALLRHSRLVSLCAPLTLLLALPPAARADDPASPPGAGPDAGQAALAPETVVTATRMAEPITLGLSATRVISAVQLAASIGMSLPEVLRQYGGVEVTSAGGPGQPSGVSIRGASTAQTLVLVDGLRLASATAGSTALEHIPVAQIDHIEVVPGPLSGLYGSDAIGGVIQIFTKGPSDEPHTEIMAGFGRNDTGQFQAFHSDHVGPMDYALGLAYLGSQAFSATNPSIDPPGTLYPTYNPDRDPYRNGSIDARLGWSYLDGHRLALALLHSNGVTHFDSGPATDDLSHQALSSISLQSDDRISADWQSRLQVGSTRDDYRATGAATYFYETVKRQLSWQNTLQTGLGHVVAGLEYLGDTVNSDTSYNQRQRDNRAGYLSYSLDDGAQSARASLRREDNSQFGGVTSATLAYAYQLSPAFRLRGSYASGFRAPTFNDLYYPGFSNPLLQPERSRSRELGGEFTRDGQRISVSAFQNDIHDLITPDINGVPYNLGIARIRGVEARLSGRIDAIRYEWIATVQDPVDAQTGLRLQRRASSFASARLSRRVVKVDCAVEWSSSDARFDSATQDPATRLGGYALVNLLATWKVWPQWQAEVRANNLFNRQYTLIQGYNTAGSTLFASLRWTPQ